MYHLEYADNKSIEEFYSIFKAKLNEEGFHFEIISESSSSCAMRLFVVGDEDEQNRFLEYLDQTYSINEQSNEHGDNKIYKESSWEYYIKEGKIPYTIDFDMYCNYFEEKIIVDPSYCKSQEEFFSFAEDVLAMMQRYRIKAEIGAAKFITKELAFNLIEGDDFSERLFYKFVRELTTARDVSEHDRSWVDVDGTEKVTHRIYF